MTKIQAHLIGEMISSNSPEAYSLYKKTFFLVEKEKIEIFSKNKKISKKELINKLQKIDKKMQIKYLIFKDLRKKGYIVKTGLKFGAEFRVYDKGVKLEKKHARWIVFIEHEESEKLTWHEFSAKDRVAHSTKKKLLLAIVDEEGEITYYEISWLKP